MVFLIRRACILEDADMMCICGGKKSVAYLHECNGNADFTSTNMIVHATKAI